VNAVLQQPNILGPPTLAGYSAFLYNTVGVQTAALPTDSFNINLSFALAMDIVSTWLQCMQSDVYTIAVYNLATDRLINFCPDQPGQSYFEGLRTKFDINQFVAGVVQADYDQGTGTTLVVPEAFKTLTMLDLSALNTNYGRAYLGLAQQIGTLWGLT
jgi:hypothetical protein